MRNTFASTLEKLMKRDERIYLLTGDLGFGMFDSIRDKFDRRFINAGIAEQNMIGVAAGMASVDLIPLVYSITPFLIYRAYEFIRNELNHDGHNVKLVGGGRDRDYGYLGFTHWCEDDQILTAPLKNLKTYWPKSRDEIPGIMKEMIKIDGPCYLNLARVG